MSLLGNIRAGVMSNLSTLSVNGDGYLLTPPEPPCFEVASPDDGYVYGPTFQRGTDSVTIIVRGIIQLGESTESQKTLDDWMEPSGSTSVKTLLESDRTLGGAVDDLMVVSVIGPRRLATPEVPGAIYLCAEWLVRIIVSPQ